MNADDNEIFEVLDDKDDLNTSDNFYCNKGKSADNTINYMSVNHEHKYK